MTYLATIAGHIGSACFGMLTLCAMVALAIRLCTDNNKPPDDE